MESIFTTILNMSITAGWLILAVVVIRLLLQKAPKWIRGILWAMVGIRLIIPFSFESVFSLIPDSSSIEVPYRADALLSTDGNGELQIPQGTLGMDIVQSVTGSTLSEVEEVLQTDGPLLMTILAIIWLVGIVCMLLHCLVSYIRLRKRVEDAVIYSSGKPIIYQSEKVASPFVLGFFKPRIYLPFQMSESDMDCVIAHERAHIARLDHWIKPFGFFVLAVYWFHPLVWVAYILLCRDIELACDEKVIKEMNVQNKKAYSEALMRCSVQQHVISACPLAFGEVGVKKRILNVLHYKKPTFWVILISLVACVIVAVCFLTNPKEEDLRENVQETQEEEQANMAEQESQQKELTNSTGTDEEQMVTKEDKGPNMQKALTTPPTMYLQNALSSYWNEFPVNSSTYGWSYRNEEGNVLCIDAAAKYGVSGEVKGKEWLQVWAYEKIDAPYMARFEVWPDSMCIREYDLLDLGDMEPELLSKTFKEEFVGLLELKPRRIYEITANWSEEKFEERGFDGSAVYIFATDNYAVSGTELQGETLPVLIEAVIKETMVDTKDRICISSRTDDFPGAFILIVPQEVYDKTKLQGGERLIVSMKDTGERKKDDLPIYEAIYLQPVEEASEIKTMPGLNLPSVRARWTEEVNTFSGAGVYFDKYSATGGDLEFVNRSDRDLQYGEWFDIQRRVDGEWYSLSYAIDNIAFHQVAYLLPKGETSIKTITWDWMYGKLPPGEYRIVTEVDDYRAPGDFDKYYLAEEFEIKQSVK